MPYRIVIEKKAAKEADGVPAKQRSFIDKAILELADEPRPYGSKKLTDKEGYRIKAGQYRILYTIDDKGSTVVIYRIKIRNEATYR